MVRLISAGLGPLDRKPDAGHGVLRVPSRVNTYATGDGTSAVGVFGFCVTTTFTQWAVAHVAMTTANAARALGTPFIRRAR